MRINFRYKTILGVALIEAVFLGLLIVNSLHILSSSHENELQHRAQTLTDVFSKAISDAVLSLDLATLNTLVDDLMASSEVIRVDVSNDQQVLVSRLKNIDSIQIEDVVRSVSDLNINGTQYGTVEVWLDGTYVADIVQHAQKQSIQIALVEILFSGIASLFLGIYLTQQLSRLKKEIESVEQGDLSKPNSNLNIPDDELGDTLNAFLQLKSALIESNADRETVLAQVSQLAKENRDKETWLKAIINQLVDGVIAFDEQGSIHYANEPAMQMLGYSGNALIGLTVYDLPLTEVQHSRIKSFVKTGSSDRIRESLTRHRNELIYRKDGAAVTASVTLNYTRINETDYFILSLGEVSWRRQVERQMMISDAIRTGILESSVSAIVAIDQNDRILEFNNSAELMFGFRRQKVMGETMAELIMPERFRQAHRMGMTKFLASGEGPVLGQRIEIIAIDHDHREFPISLAITPIQTAEGFIFTAVIEDISDRIENTQRLTAAKEQADRANQEKSRFLASMSHEIRTPLNVMLGMVDLLQGTSLDDQQNTFAVSAENAGRNLLDMINDVLDLSKIEAGKMEPNNEYFDPIQVFEDTIQLFVQRCWSKSLRMLVFVGQEIPSKIFSDTSYFRQIITNLMANAVNYTDAGHIEAKIYLHRINGLMHLIVDVKDTGSGLSEEQQSLLFQDFSQIQQEKPKESRGTGLGLVICREMANLLGGDISLRSEPGSGSVFSLQLPLAVEPLSKKVQPLRGFRCGLLSNSQGWNLNMEHQMGCWGLAVHKLEHASISSPEEATLDGLDIVLVDVANIEVDTVDKLLQANRVKERTCHVIQFIENNRSVFNDALVDETLPQPVQSSRLLTALKHGLRLEVEHIAKKPHLDSNREVIVEVTGEGKILLVDDSEGNRVIASAYLNGAGYDVVEATDGVDALTKLKRTQVDLILMDIRMPTMGGVECAKTIRQDRLAKDVPIIALTAHAMLEAREECLAVGMQDFLTKPIDRKKLLETVSKWLSSTRSNQRGLSQLKISPTISNLDLRDDAEFDLFNKFAIDQLVEDTSKAATSHMLNVFFGECERRKDLIAQAQKDNNLSDFEVSVHALKSSAKTFGAEYLSETARQAEEASRLKDTEKAWELGRQLSPIVTETLETITSELASWWQPEISRKESKE